jgi:branched-subunit amino acid aminotransferase/4-amino-4-deoxychorismate lyase
MPVTKMEARDLGEPGPITRQLRAAYLDLVERETNTAA